MSSYEVLPGVLTQQALAAGGGGGGGSPTVSISIATSSSGNFDNAMKVGFYHSALGDYIFDCADLDGQTTTDSQDEENPFGAPFSQFGYFTGTSPTRTIQNIPMVSSSFADTAFLAGPQIAQPLVVGGYARGVSNGVAANGSVSNVVWGTAGASQIITQQASNGCAFTMVEMSSQNSRQNTQDNTAMTDGFGQFQGIYGSNATGSGTGIFMLHLFFGGGRAGLTYPNPGDYCQVRYTLDAQVSSVAATQVIHEVAFVLM